MKHLVVLLLSIIFISANTDINIDNGKTLFYSFDKIQNPKIKLGKKTLSIHTHPSKKDKYLAIIPINYKTKDQNKTLKIYSNKKLIDSFTFDITKGEYKKETLKVSKKHISPPKETLKRIKKEYKEAMKIYYSSSKTNHLNGKFELPIDSKVTSSFGNARVFNDTLKSYHSGTDFRAKVGTPIKAINDGVVVLSKNRYYAGGSVIIDHGLGIYSCYYHLSEFKAKVGDKIKKGQVIAHSGKSGRITGPHLHLTIKVNGITVAPLDFINKYNNL